MFRSKSRRRVRFRTLIVRMTLTVSVALAVGIGVAKADQLTSPPLAQPTSGIASGLGTGLQQSVVAAPATQAAPTIITAATAVNPATSQILGMPQSHCGHVIDLLVRNQMRQQSGAFGSELAPGLMLSAPPASNPLGDLELVAVLLVADGGPGVGPVIEVTVRNNSTVPVGNFQISMVGVLGQIHVHCPTTRGTVTQIPAGAVAPFRLQLPASAMAMGFQGQPAAPFDTLVVAIDSFDELLEANELNNVRIIRRLELQPLAAPPVAEVVVPAVVPADPETTTTPDTAIPSPAEPSSPLDNIQFENLELETTTPTAAGMTQFFRDSGK